MRIKNGGAGCFVLPSSVVRKSIQKAGTAGSSTSIVFGCEIWAQPRSGCGLGGQEFHFSFSFFRRAAPLFFHLKTTVPSKIRETFLNSMGMVHRILNSVLGS